MAEWTIYYNPKCGSCRNALAILEKNKIKPVVVEYLKTPPTLAELKTLAKKKGVTISEMVRSKEPIYAELGLEGASADKLLKAVAENPILLQRPLVVRGDRAVVARPPEKVSELL